MNERHGMREVEQALARQRIIPVVRHRSEPVPAELVQVLVSEGLRCVEIAMTSPRALTTLRAARERLGDAVILGAGTALNAEMARLAIRAGAEFVASPGLNEAMIDACRHLDVLPLPGVMTPTEAMRAWHAGAQVVKLFPASVVGPQFLRTLKGPLPWLRIVPTGGITPENVAEFLEAGAMAVGVGSWLLREEETVAGRWQGLKDRLRELEAAIRAGH